LTGGGFGCDHEGWIAEGSTVERILEGWILEGWILKRWIP
jgi:hypothetical protein